MAKDIAYCGIGRIPSTKRRGSMKECAQKNQVRYYGIKKIDTTMLKAYDSKKFKKGSSKEKTMENLALYRARVKKLKGMISIEKDKTKKKEQEKALKIAEDALKKTAESYRKMSRSRKSKRSRKSRKSSRRN
jgi:hypothetical protein